MTKKESTLNGVFINIQLRKPRMSRFEVIAYSCSGLRQKPRHTDGTPRPVSPLQYTEQLLDKELL